MIQRRKLLQPALLAALLAQPLTTVAQDAYPSKPIKLVVAFAAGGFTDSFARITGAKMAELMGQPVVVENRVGASGLIGGNFVAKAPPDGYTFMIANNSMMSILPFATKNPPYDPEKELLPFTLTSIAELFLVVNPDKLKAKTFAELRNEINALPANSPLRAYASVGVATTHHLAMELLKMRTGLKLTHIPYKGSTPAMQDIVGGQIPIMFNTYSEVGQWIKQGKLRAIATARDTRSADLPEVPTLAEQGVTGFNVGGWQAYVVAAGTPPAVVRKLHDTYAASISDPPTKQKLASIGVVPIVTSTEEATRYIRADAANWASVIKSANITLE